jgi:hypothetical protein
MDAPAGSIFLETDRLIFRSHESRDESAFVAIQTDARSGGAKSAALERELAEEPRRGVAAGADLLAESP